MLSNPNNEPAIVTWRGSGITIDDMSSYALPWPPTGLDGASTLKSDLPIPVTWTSTETPTGVYDLGAIDTGMESGLQIHSNNSNSFNLELRSNGEQSIINASTCPKTKQFSILGRPFQFQSIANRFMSIPQKVMAFMQLSNTDRLDCSTDSMTEQDDAWASMLQLRDGLI